MHLHGGTWNEAEVVICPRMVGHHWFVVTLTLATGEVRVYDSAAPTSQRGRGRRNLEVRRLCEMFDVHYGVHNFKIIHEPCIQQGPATNDCGMYAAQNIARVLGYPHWAAIDRPFLRNHILMTAVKATP